MVTREDLLEKAGNERNPTILDLWRECLRMEVAAALVDVYFAGTQQYETALDQVMLHIEQYGCSVPKAIDRIMNPDLYIHDKNVG
jgi:hypothetical protein